MKPTCHPEREHYTRGFCIECYCDHYPDNPVTVKSNASSRDWKSRNPEKVREQKRRYRKKHAARLKRKASEYQSKRWKARFEKIAGRPKPKNCEICNQTGRICFDHCHRSDKFRGWICSQCNIVLGMVYDSPELLEKMISYLNK